MALINLTENRLQSFATGSRFMGSAPGSSLCKAIVYPTELVLLGLQAPRERQIDVPRHAKDEPAGARWRKVIHIRLVAG